MNRQSTLKDIPVILLSQHDALFLNLTHPLTPSLKLEKGNCGVVIPLSNFREGDRGGELR